MQLFLFDTLRIKRGEQTRLLKGVVAALLGYLGLQNAPVSRSQLAGTLFPEVTEEHARRLLTHALYRLRKEIGAAYLLVENDAIGLCNLWIDVVAFRESADLAISPDQASASNSSHQRTAIDLYQGDLLSSIDGDWMLGQRALLREQFLLLLATLTQSYIDNDQLSDALLTAHRWTQSDPFDETSHRALMQIYERMGRHTAALDHYKRLCTLLKNELAADPMPATAAAAAAISAAMQSASTTKQPQAGDTVHFVGRREERKQLISLIDGLAPGRGRLVLLEGEPGIGKSRLLDELVLAANWREIAVGLGESAETELPQLLSPLSNALAQLITNTRAAILTPQLTPMVRTALASIMPVFQHKTQRPTATGASQQTFATIELALRQLLQALLSDRPLVLLLDDLQWADDMLWAMLPLLNELTHTQPLLLVLAFRSNEMREHRKAWPLLRSLDAESQPLRLRLTGLSQVDSVDLLRYRYPALNSDSVESLAQQAAGNPLYLLELAQNNGQTASSIEVLISQRVASLSPSARAALDAASVFTSSFSLVQWHALGISDIPLIELASKRFIHESEQRFTFSHALVRSYLYSQLSEKQRHETHLAAAAWLASMQADSSELAHHYLQGNQPEVAFEQLCNSVDEALAYNLPPTAQARLVRAEQLIPKADLSAAENARYRLLRLRVAQVATWSSKHDDEAQDLIALAEQAREFEIVHGALLLRMTHMTMQGQHDTFDALVQQALDLARELGDVSAEIRTLLTAASSLDSQQYRSAAARPLAEQALELAQTLPYAPHFQLGAHLLLATIDRRQKHMDAAALRHQLAKAQQLIEKHDGLEGFELQLLQLQAFLAQAEERFEDARLLHQRRYRLVQAVSDYRMTVSALFSCTQMATKLAQLEEAVMYSEEALRFVLQHAEKADAYHHHFFRTSLADRYTQLGDLDAAAEVFAEVDRWLGTNPEGRSAFYGHLIKFVLRHNQKRWAEAYGAAQAALAIELPQGSLSYMTLLMCAEAAHNASAPDAAQKHLADARDLIDLAPNNSDVIYFYLLDGLINDSPLALAMARQKAVSMSYTVTDRQIRQDMFVRKPICQTLTEEWQRLDVPERQTALVDGVMVTWTVDDRLADAQLAREQGKVTLRQHRLQRLVLEANIAGVQPPYRYLAQALGVSIRTIERDVRALAKTGIKLYTHA